MSANGRESVRGWEGGSVHDPAAVPVDPRTLAPSHPPTTAGFATEESILLSKLRERRIVSPESLSRSLLLRDLLAREGIRKPVLHVLWETGALDDLALRALLDSESENGSTTLTASRGDGDSADLELGTWNLELDLLHRFSVEEDRLLQHAFLKEAPGRLMEIDRARVLRERLLREGYDRSIADLLVDLGVTDLETARWWINIQLGRETAPRRKRPDPAAEAAGSGDAGVRFLTDDFGAFAGSGRPQFGRRLAFVAAIALAVGAAAGVFLNRPRVGNDGGTEPTPVVLPHPPERAVVPEPPPLLQDPGTASAADPAPPDTEETPAADEPRTPEVAPEPDPEPNVSIFKLPARGSDLLKDPE